MSDDLKGTGTARFTGFGADGKPRYRGSYEGFIAGAEQYRNMGLGKDVLFAPKMSARAEVSANRERGLVNSRDAERNTEMIRGGLDRKANTVIGPVLRPNPQPDITWLNQDADWMLEYQQAASSAFQEWATDIHCRGDAEGHYQFGGLMWQGFRTLAGPDSEVLGYIGYDRDRANRKGWKWATYVKMVDPDRLSNPMGLSNGPNQRLADGSLITLQDGRELDENDAMEALHIRVGHPSDISNLGTPRWERIPRIVQGNRPMGFHWFFKRRAGLQRALTTLAAVLSTIEMLSQFSRATLQHAVSQAYMATYLKTTMSAEQAAEHMAPGGDDGKSEYDYKADAYEKMNLTFGGKRIPVLGPNDEIKFEGLEGSQMDFDPFRNAFLRELASSLNVSFEQLSLDFSKASYSSTRSSISEAWRSVTFERIMFTQHVASLVYDAVIEEAFALDILKPPPGAPDFYDARGAYTRCFWTGPGMGWVDPLKEVAASNRRMGSVLSTLSSESSSQGTNWQDNIIQRGLEIKFAEKHKVPLDLTVQGVTIQEDVAPAPAAPTNQGASDE
jgi:lambda family phage portal protein